MVKMDVNQGTYPRILLRSPTADEELSKVVSSLLITMDDRLNGVTNREESPNSDIIGNGPNLEPPRIFSVSSSSSLTSDEPSPLLTPARSPVSHQRSISLVDPTAKPMVPMVDPDEDSSRRPRGMSLPFGSSGPDTTKQRRRGMSFLHLNEGGLSALYNQLQHLPVPTLTISTPAGDMGGRKFSFGLRRLSQTTLNRSDSMISLSFRSLVNFITEDNLPGLRSYLDSRKNQVDDRDENNSTALLVAAAHGKLPFIHELIRFGADVNAEDADNWSALLCSAKEGHYEVCRELLDHGAIVDHRDMASWTPLLWASYKGRTSVAELLIERQADVNAHENYHISPLHWACGRGHVEIARMLIARGAKINVGDKYGTTPLIWASRKGAVEIVEMLLKAGAHVDASGMNSWTPLLVATAGNHVEVVNLLLEHKPNVNALDKDGYTALAISCKEGFNEIAQALLLIPGVYVNLQDRSGDTNLIHAVKGGHKGIVEALLKKYVDIDTAGKDKKTAVYTAVEKGNNAVVKLLLSANPDLEGTTKDGDTALLRAVRTRNAEIVQMLLEKKAKVSATDKKGDTALHISMRARSKAIVEIILRNPKHSSLLYRPNRSGETPYNIDINHNKSILNQILGKLNTNEENENLLGYDLYSSALADILAEPSLSMPITVGLYAKWGSGKSFLLTKLSEEMNNFALRWTESTFGFTSILIAIMLHVSVILGVILAVVTSWLWGIILGSVVLFLIFAFLMILRLCSKRYDWIWANQASVGLSKRMSSFRLLLQVMFCNPPGSQFGAELPAQPIRFYFTDQARISNTTGGEHYVSQMLGSLYDSIEADYGVLATRLYRAFRPTAHKSTSSWKWRKACCLPYIVIFELWLVFSLVEIILLAAYFNNSKAIGFEEETLKILIIVLGTIISAAVFANMYTISHLTMSLIFSQRRHLQRSIARIDVVKSEGFLPALKKEVALMTDMVKCLDALTGQQSRLVVIVDGLDACDQDKVLMVLDTVHLLSDVNSPFIIVLAIDPHIISKAVELNSRRLTAESNISGHEYLRNMVHLPFFLANSALRRVKTAQSASRRSTLAPNDSNEDAGPQLSARRLSIESNFTASTEKLKLPSRKGSRKLKMSESVASSIGSNLNKICGAQDLTKMLLTDDYFSDVNPRSMRRLLNVIYVTGRLLRAFQMDFNWYHLALWVNLTEQWPYRCSWLILYYELFEERLEDQTPLKSIYDEVRTRIPPNKEVEPLLEVDRDEKKFDVFLTYHRSTLLLSDLKVFLPFTINLDPYFKKVIKEEMQEDQWSGGLTMNPRRVTEKPMWGKIETAVERRARRPAPIPPPHLLWTNQGWMQLPSQSPSLASSTSTYHHQPLSAASLIPSEVLDMKLSSRAVEDVCELITRTTEISQESAAKYTALIIANNISGRVLLHCDLNELKVVLQMTFGDWELFKLLVVSLREHELTTVTQMEETSGRNVRFVERKRLSEKKRTDSDKRQAPIKHTVVENQVTLEDEMICGALTTLSEEACEDVLDGAGGDLGRKDTSVVYLQSSPLSQPTWQVADDSSAPSSVNATPTFHRKRSTRTNRSRPTSLSVDTVSPPLSPNLKLNRKIDSSPQVIITPVSSIEKLHRLKDKLLKSSEAIVSQGGNSVYDDENVPLVLEIHENNSSEASPVSGPLSNEQTDSRSSEISVGNLLDRSKSFESITSSRSHFDRFSVEDYDMQLRVKNVRSPPLVRQHEIRPDSSLALEWDGPETSV